MRPLTLVLSLAGFAPGIVAQQPPLPIVLVHTCAGTDIEGALATKQLQFLIGSEVRQIAVADLLSVQSAVPAVAEETARITAGLQAIVGTDAKAVEAAVASLTDIGLPVLTPLLDSYADVDAHEPDPRYRLFARIVPCYADCKDRTLDLIRLADGSVLRGHWQPIDLALQDANGSATTVHAADIRRLAVRRAKVERTFPLQALHDCTYVGWVDTGIAVTATSTMRADAEGYVRLSFGEDGWATDPDGIHDPLPGKRKLQEGFRWGSVLARVGVTGERWFVGRHVEKGELGSGRLYFVVNDNEHWQNNIGGYRVRLAVTNAYDLGDAQ